LAGATGVMQLQIVVFQVHRKVELGRQYHFLRPEQRYQQGFLHYLRLDGRRIFEDHLLLDILLRGMTTGLRLKRWGGVGVVTEMTVFCPG
jgi:hypothetical protein